MQLLLRGDMTTTDSVFYLPPLWSLHSQVWSSEAPVTEV